MVVICLVTLLGICICSYIWVRTQVMHIQAQRKLLFAAVQVGDELEENIQIINNGIFPVLWIAVEDNSNFPAYSIRSVRAVDPQSKTTWRYHLTCKQRGIFTLGPWQWTSSDPFGIFYLRRSYLHTQQMVVYPPLAFFLHHFCLLEDRWGIYDRSIRRFRLKLFWLPIPDHSSRVILYAGCIGARRHVAGVLCQDL